MGEGKTCQGCGKMEGEARGMVRCKGCECVWYCGKVNPIFSLIAIKLNFKANYLKECQVLGWTEKVTRVSVRC